MPDLELKRKSKVSLLCLDVLADLLSLGKREASYQKAKMLKQISKFFHHFFITDAEHRVHLRLAVPEPETM